MRSEIVSYTGPIEENNVIPSAIEMDDILYMEIEDVCKTARIFDPYSIVAGGCLRDSVFGKKVNDIDVYLNSSGGYPEYVMKGIVERLGYLPVLVNDHPAYGHNPRIQGVVTCSKEGLAHPVQFIFMHPKDSTFREVSKFDINISKFWCQHPARIKVSMDVLRFIRTGIVSRTPGIEINEGYVDKIRAKYPEFKWEEDPIPVVNPGRDALHGLGWADPNFPNEIRGRNHDVIIVDDLQQFRPGVVFDKGQIKWNPEPLLWDLRGDLA